MCCLLGFVSCFFVLLFFSKSVKGMVIIEGIYEVRDRYIFILVAQNAVFIRGESLPFLLQPDTL